MKNCKNREKKDRKRFNPLFFVSAMIIIVVIAMTFAAVDIFVAGEDSPTASAYSSQSTIHNNVLLGSTRLKSTSTYTRTFGLSGTDAKLYGNGALNVEYKLIWNSHGAYKDFGEMKLNATGISESDKWKREGSMTKYLRSNSPYLTSGYSSSYTISYSVKAWEELTGWPPFQGSVDTSVELRTTIKTLKDTTAPEVDEDSIQISQKNTYTQTKLITFDIIDKLGDGDQCRSGVNPSSIKINGRSPISQGTETGTKVSGVSYNLGLAGPNNLKITYEDYFGNKGTFEDTVDYIDTSPPEVEEPIVPTSTEWTNESAELTATARDEVSGIKIFNLADKTETYNNPGNTSWMSLKTTVTKNGSYSGYVEDYVGYQTEFNDIDVWWIDKDKPNIDKLFYDESWTNDNVILYIKASDALSGIDKVKVSYKLGGVTIEEEADESSFGDYTHEFIMNKDFARTEYTIRAYDKAGNVSDVGDDEKVTPNIDITPPSIYSPSLIGTKENGDEVNASVNYSFGNITVIVQFSDSGGSGVSKIELNGKSYDLEDVEEKEFDEIITKNTIDQEEYTIYLWDNAGNLTTRKIEPLKDDAIPEIRAIGENDWGTSAQTIQAEFWVGLSGGTIEMKRSYLGGPLGAELLHYEDDSFATFSQGTDFYDSSNEPIYQYRTHDVNIEGEEFYHFKLTNGAGVSTGWIGLDYQEEATSFETDQNGRNAYIDSTGARTRIDRTAPKITLWKYESNSGMEVNFEDFSGENWLGESVTAYYIINDGIEVGGDRSDGINSSGIGVATYIKGEGAPETIDPYPDVQNADRRYDNNPSVRMFNIVFSNEDLIYESGKSIPEYRIYAEDALGNISEEIVILPQIDDLYYQSDFLEVNSVLERIDSQTTKAYDYTWDGVEENKNWTNNSIEIDISKQFGMSGAYLCYYIDETRETTFPDITDEEWIEHHATSSTPLWTFNQTIVIPKSSVDATVFIAIFSGAKYEYYDSNEEKWITKREGYKLGGGASNYHIFIDNDNPVIEGSRYEDENQRELTEEDWSPSDVNLYVDTNDISPTTGAEGSRVAEVVSNIKGTVTITQVILEAGGVQDDFWVGLDINFDIDIIMDMDGVNVWVIENLLDSIRTRLLLNESFYSQVKTSLNNQIFDYMEILAFTGGGDYSVEAAVIGLVDMGDITIEAIDNVGLRTLSPEKPFIPKIDLIKPVLQVNSTNYESNKGGFDELDNFNHATPVNNSVSLNLSSAGNVIASGGQIYILKRAVDNFIETRLTAQPKQGYQLITKEEIEDEQNGWEAIYPVSENQAFYNVRYYINPALGEVEHKGIDVVVVSNAGHITHVEYGVVFVDRQSPNLVIDQILYTREDGGEAVGVIPGPGEQGEWTNSTLEVEMYVTDYDGSGVKEDSVYIDMSSGNLYPKDIIVDEKGNGYYVFEGIDTYTKHTLHYRDLAGNSGEYEFTPLIDREEPTISLYAEDEDGNIYNINPLTGEGVNYINKKVTIYINLQYGRSSFKRNEYSWDKGSELYSLVYVVDGADDDAFDITKLMGEQTSWTNPYDNNTFELDYQDQDGAQYIMRLSDDQNREFKFIVSNGIKNDNAMSNPSTSGTPQFSGQTYYPQVKIDQTPPEIKNIEINSVNIDDWSNDSWTFEDITVSFELDDPFSGVRHDSDESLEQKSVVLVIRDTTPSQNEISREILSLVGGEYTFTMKGYYNYYIEFEDNIGNGSGTIVGGDVSGKEGGFYGPIMPLIDKHEPNFIKDDNENIYTLTLFDDEDEDFEESYEEGEWTYYNIKANLTTSVGISGQKLQYQKKSLSASGWTGEWITIREINEEETLGLDELITEIEYKTNDETGVYRFRVISEAGLYSEFESIIIKIDKYNPTIDVTAKEGTTTSASDYVAGEWARDTVVFEIAFTSGNSGAIVEYSVNRSDSTSWTSTGGPTRGFMSYDAISRTYKLNVTETTANPVSYSFRVKSNAGKEVIYDFGLVRIDKATNLNISYSIKTVASEDVVKNPGENTINYESTWDKGVSATLGKWTNYYVMIRINSTVGPSGGQLYYRRDKGEWEQDDLYNKTLTLSNKISYILLDENQNTEYDFRLESNSGVPYTREVSRYDGNVMIDMEIPYMRMTISGEKSVKWTDDSVDDMHKWYTEYPEILFEVGKFDESNDFIIGYPASDAEVYYSFEQDDSGNDKWILTGINNNNSQGATTLIIDNKFGNIQTFKFKIVSGAGHEFIIEDEYSNPANLEGKGLWEKGLTSDSPGEFTIKVDTEWYTIDIKQSIKGYGDLPEVSNDDMATLRVERNSQEIEAPYRVKRGDNVIIQITEKDYEQFEENGYHYHFKRVEFAGQELNAEGTAYIDEDYVYEGSQGEFFSFDVFDMNYSIESYFLKEIKIDYDNLNQIKQISTILPVEISSEYGDSELEYEVLYSGESFYPEYKSYDQSAIAPTETGNYTLFVNIANDDPEDPNYTINNPDGYEMVIVYFENHGTEQAPVHNINDATDFGYISIYNDPDPKFDFLGFNHTTSVYNQTQNFEIGKDFEPIYGNFTGVYDGKNKEIISEVEIEADGAFGLFESIYGTVRNLGIKLYTVVVDEAENVGFLAGSANNANIRNIYAIGELLINGEDANIGGLIGHAYSQTTINNCYTDISMSNKGNQLSGNVGGMIGLTDDISLTFTYSLGAIEAYDIDMAELNIGQVTGSILSIMEGDNTLYGNKYLERNLFVNEEIEENNGLGYVESGLTIAPSAVEALYFARFVDEYSYLDVVGATNIAQISIANVSIEEKYIMNLAIGRIEDLGMLEGLGLPNDPFIVDSSDALAFIDKYVWANYMQTEDINLEGEFDSIAAHKVFTGNYNGNMNRINNVVMTSQSKNTGFIGKLAGTIENLDIRGLDISINYMGTEDAYAGGIAGLIVPGAMVRSVYVLGNIVASTPNAKMHIGGIAGFMEGATLTDVLSIANVRTEENSFAVDIGGTVGLIKNSVIDTAFSLARVEGNYQGTGSVGAAIGTLSGDNTIENLYALEGNTYAHSQGYDYLAGYVTGTGLSGSDLQPGSNDQFANFGQLREINPAFIYSGDRLNDVLEEVYPLSGLGTMVNPFEINTVEDFAYINDFLYAHYRLKNDIDFTGYEFTTIGMNAKFTGSISGAMTHTDYQNQGGTGPRSYRLSGLTDALVYHNAGSIRDLRIEIFYNEVKNTDTIFGAVAIYNSGTIQGVNAEGYISLRVTGNRTAIVGGFVGIDLGGEYLEGEEGETSRELSSINNIALVITASTINAGGFIGRVTGPTFLSYIISDADIICTGGAVSAGTIAGTIFSGGMVYEHQIDDTAARVYINGVENTKEYGFNIKDLI